MRQAARRDRICDGMITFDQFCDIHHAIIAEHKTVGEVANQLRLDRKTVSKWVALGILVPKAATSQE